MAKVAKSILPIVGTLDDVTFYYLNGQHIVRKASAGFNGKRIKTDPAMRRVRENAKEFGHCSEGNKLFRYALTPLFTGYKFTFLHSRLMSLFQKVKKLDTTSKRGERQLHKAMLHSQAYSLFQQFNYTPSCSISQLLGTSPQYENGVFKLDAVQLSLDLPADAFVHVKFGFLSLDFEYMRYALEKAYPVVITQDHKGESFERSLVAPTADALPFVITIVENDAGQLYHDERFVGLEVL